MPTDRKTEILDAFMKLVSRFGFDKTTMQDVAKEAGISVAVIYKDYKNKEDLIEDYIQRMEEQFILSCESFLKIDSPPEKRLHDFIIGFFQNLYHSVRQDRGFLQLINGEGTFKYLRCNYKREHRFISEATKMIQQIMEQGTRNGVFQIENPSETAVLFMKAFNEYIKMIFLEQEYDCIMNGVERMFAFLVRAVQKTA